MFFRFLIMSKNSKAFLKAREYMSQQLPAKMRLCQKEVLEYGTCVSEWDNLRKGDCNKQFIVLKKCIAKTAIK